MNITALYDQSVECRAIEKSLSQGISPILVYGSEPSANQWVALSLAEKRNAPIIIVYDDDIKAKAAYEEMGVGAYLPSKEIIWFSSFARSKNNDILRAEVLFQLASKSIPLCFTSVKNLMLKYVSPDIFLNTQMTIDMNTEISLSSLTARLVDMGYERVDMVDAKGQFSIRGGIIDIFSAGQHAPFRIELFGDEVDSIRWIDVSQQTSIEHVTEAHIYPASEYATTLSVREFVEQLGEEDYFTLCERQFAKVIPQSFSLIDYAGSGATMVSGNQSVMLRMQQISEDFERQFQQLLEGGEVTSDQFGRYYTVSEIIYMLKNSPTITTELLLKTQKELPPQQIVQLQSRTPGEYHGHLDLFLSDFAKWQLSGYQIVVSTQTEERLSHIISYAEKMDLSIERGKTGIVSHASHGFLYDTFKVVLITEHEIFGEVKRPVVRRGKAAKTREIKSLSSLTSGDYVVHEKHGIGIFTGIEQMVVDRMRKDYLKIEYANESNLYIPVESTDLIQKYLGSDKERLSLSTLGGNEWGNTKKRAQKHIEDITDELLALYAERMSRVGYAFSPDTEWQKEFEQLFPYEETDDQLKCIDEIKQDMEKPIPMERLLCGDVGYGKTEVAMRAAFKAIADSKQVAMMVPTTILAQQHYNNFMARFSKYPIRCELISRFRSAKEIKEVIRDLKAGNIDLIVGTHRLISDDVVFKNLGLLIIDEEQRFGVKHKEKIKQVRGNVDVLTLTATPIPRTLHMSLLGIRDMSVIEDPPEDRYPIQTYVLESDESVIREAITREMERGGQVYFVHNRIQNIERITASLSKILPNANIDFAHGRMSEHQLERVMMRFLEGEIDVLVTTTIIETGLDISNVNTMIINDGDRMGLSQLYQLRGRVGRSNRMAYCYVFFKKDKVLNEVAEKRLKAIKEFTDLGSGFNIAMRDLEIRGAGNLLGTEQSGFMNAIGYDLYCKLLDQSIRMKRGETVKEEVDARIDFAIDAYIPETYIENSDLRLEAYKQIAVVESMDEKMDLYDTLLDRYGEVPFSVDHLLRIALIKSYCQKMEIESVEKSNHKFILKFSPNATISPIFLSKVLEYGANMISFYGGLPSEFRIKVTNSLRNEEKELVYLENTLETIYIFYSQQNEERKE